MRNCGVSEARKSLYGNAIHAYYESDGHYLKPKNFPHGSNAPPSETSRLLLDSGDCVRKLTWALS